MLHLSIRNVTIPITRFNYLAFTEKKNIMSKLNKIESEIVILELELKKLDLDLKIITEKYVRDLIEKKRANSWADDVMRRKTNIQKKINYKKHELENPAMYY